MNGFKPPTTLIWLQRIGAILSGAVQAWVSRWPFETFRVSGNVVQRGVPSRTLLVVFGVVLGTGYLFKSAMFPAGLVFLACAAWSLRRGFRTRLAYGLASFGIVAGAQIFRAVANRRIPDIRRKRSAELLLLLNPNPSLARPYLPIDPRDVAIAPTKSDTARVLHRSPDVLEFKSRAGWSYPVWDDPVYWSGHPKRGFSLRRQVEMVVADFVLLLRILAPVFAGLAILVAVNRSIRLPGRELSALMISGAAVVCMYLLVHLQARYIAVSVITLFLPLLWAQTTPSLGRFALRARVALLVAAIPVLGMGWGMRHQIATIVEGNSGSNAPFSSLRVARRAEINQLFASQNMRMIVANLVPAGAPTEGWTPLGLSGYFVLPLPIR